jgi:SEC-C motif-containing protein
MILLKEYFYYNLKILLTMTCHCQSNKPYSECCEPYHQGQAAPTAEALMRSRYSAYVLNNTNYIYKSWSQATRPSKKSLKQGEPMQWQSLEIIKTESGSALDTEGVVEFKATYVAAEKIETLHEVSRFIRENSRWVYLDGNY